MKERANMRTMYEVAIESRGKVMIDGGVNNPAQGLLVRKIRWDRITPRPIGLARAKALADAEHGHATVCVWSSAEVVYDNGKPPFKPVEWWPETATCASESKSLYVAPDARLTEALVCLGDLEPTD